MFTKVCDSRSSFFIRSSCGPIAPHRDTPPRRAAARSSTIFSSWPLLELTTLFHEAWPLYDGRGSDTVPRRTAPCNNAARSSVFLCAQIRFGSPESERLTKSSMYPYIAHKFFARNFRVANNTSEISERGSLERRLGDPWMNGLRDG